jgi:nitroimidazol reductase NimA-like FMN-containing flavoprotein (pyridoxamine 5'-phosphate oxidase superfamily)
MGNAVTESIHDAPGSTDRTRVRRLPEKAVNDREVLHAVLDAGLVAHVAVVDDGQPFVIPVAFARRGEQVLFHGSTGSRLFRLLDEGQPTCLTVTLVDGLVLARSAFESSINYRSVVVLGSAHRVEGDDELDALRVITEHLLPGRWAEARHPSRKERAATMTLALDLSEASVKIGTGGPTDDPEDLTDPALMAMWAGHVPISEVLGEPVADDLCPPGTPVPDYVRGWSRS